MIAFSNPLRHLLLGIGMSIALLQETCVAAENVHRRTDSNSADLISELLDLGLIDTASRICAGHLAETQSDSDATAKWLIESARTKIAAMLHDDPATASAQRDQATEELDRFLANHPKHPRELWLRFQRELIDFADSRRGVGMAVIKPANDPARDEMAKQIIRLSSRMQVLSKEVADEVAIERSQRPDSILTTDLVALALVIANRRIDAVMLRGELFAEGSDDYVASANESLLASRALLDSLPAGADGRGDLVKRFAESLRRTGELEQAAEAISPLLEANPNDDEARALVVRVALDMGDLALAAKTMEGIDELSSDRSVELDLARLQWVIAKAKDLPSATSQREMGDWIERIGKRHGHYARRRAEQQVLASGGQANTSLDPRIVIAGGASLIREGKPQEAADWLAAAMRASKAPSAAFQIAIAAASAYRHANHPTAAASVLREVSLEHFDHADAAKLHLQAAILLADHASPESLIEHLEECTSTWPKSDAAVSASDWLIRLHEARGDWLSAATAASNVDPASMTPDRVIRAGERWRKAIQTVPAADRTAAVQQAIDAFNRDGVRESSQLVIEELVVLFGNREQLTSLPAEAPQGHWVHWLRSIRQGTAITAPAIDAIDESLRSAAAERLVSDGETAMLNRLALADGILALVGGNPSLAAAQAYDWKNDLTRTESVLAALQLKHPDDLNLAKASAALLARSRSPAAKQAGLQRWHRLAGQLPQGSDAWHDAKLAAIELLLSLGDRVEAKRLASYVLLTQPPSSAAVAARYRKAAGP